MTTSTARTYGERKEDSVQKRRENPVFCVLRRCPFPSVSFLAVLAAVLAVSVLTPALVGVTAAQDTDAEGPTVYVGSNDGNVYAVDAEDGTEVWSFDTGGVVWSSPTVSEGTVYVGNDNGTVYAVDAEDGTEVWSYDTGEPSVRTSPTVVDGTVYIGSGSPVLGRSSGKVHALDASGGNEVWSFETGSAVQSTVSVADGTVYAGDGGGVVHALDSETGNETWTFETNTSVLSSLSVAANGSIYVGGGSTVAGSGSLYSLNTANESVSWRRELPSAMVSPPTVTGEDGRDRLYFTTVGDVIGEPGSRARGEVQAFTSSGEELWRTEIGPLADTSPTVVGEAVYVGSRDNRTYALDKQNGSVFWKFETGNFVTSSPTVADGTAYFGSRDDHLYGINASDGTERWRFETGGDIKSSPTYVEDPSGGSSVGSRLRLGTRAHHDELADGGIDSETPVRNVDEYRGVDGGGDDTGTGNGDDDGTDDDGDGNGNGDVERLPDTGTDEGSSGLPAFLGLVVFALIVVLAALAARGDL